MSYLEKLKRLEQANPKPTSVVSAPTHGVGGASVVEEIIEDGEIVAVLICSKILEAHIWFAFDESFDPKDGQAVYYAGELDFLKTKTAQSSWKNTKSLPTVISEGGEPRSISLKSLLHCSVTLHLRKSQRGKSRSGKRKRASG